LIVALGDIHFSSSKDYFVKISNDVIDWFAGWKHNNSNNELILVGDLVQTSVNAGLVIEFLYRFVAASRFRCVHILKGNHDEKLKDGVWQLAYSFLYHYPNVKIYTEATIVSIEEKSVLMLPYYMAQKQQQPMAELYSSLYKDKRYQRHFDLVVGHFADESAAFLSTESVSNLDKLDATTICLGHVHTRSSNPSRYIGSLFANRVNENANDRAAWIIDEAGKREELLPVFCEYIHVRYPDHLPRSRALTPIYTISNCASEGVARALYGNIFIRKAVQDLARSDSTLDASEIFLAEADTAAVFTEFMKSLQPPIDRRVATICVPLVKNTTKSTDGSNRNPATTVL